MGLTITNSSYSGQHAGEYLAAALLTNDTVANGGVTVKANILHKEVMNVIATTGDLIANASCDFTESGAVAMTERVLQVEDFQINQKICKSTFSNDFLAAEAGFSAHKNMPATFEKFIIEYFSKQIAAKMENNIWSGTNSAVGSFDGFSALAAADSDVIDVTSSAITTGNILDKLSEVANAIPGETIYSPDQKIYLSSKDFQKFIRSQGGFLAGGQGAAGIDNKGAGWWNGQNLAFDGIPVFLAPGLVENTVFAAESTNLFYGLSLLSDTQEIKIIDTSETLGDNNIRFSARFSAGVQYGLGSQIVYRVNA